MNTTLSQVPIFLRNSFLYKNLSEDFLELPQDEYIQKIFYEELSFGLIVKNEEVNSLEDFKNLLDVELYWGTETFSLSLYTYAIFHRDEVLQFLEIIDQETGELAYAKYKKIANEIRYYTFILDNKEKMIEYLLENVQFPNEIIAEIKKSNKYEFLSDRRSVYIKVNNCTIISFPDHVLIDLSLEDEDYFFPALLIKKLVEEKNEKRYTLNHRTHGANKIYYEITADELLIKYNGMSVKIILTTFTRPLIIKSLKKFYNQQVKNMMVYINQYLLRDNISSKMIEDVVNIEDLPSEPQGSYRPIELIQYFKDVISNIKNEDFFLDSRALSHFNVSIRDENEI